MTIIHVIVLICLNYNIRFTISHVAGHANVHADHLSWLQLQVPQLHRRHRKLAILETPGPSLALIQQHITQIIQSAHQPNTHSIYNWAWDLFMQFLTTYNKTLDDLSEHLLMEFIACLSLIPLVLRSIQTYLSGVRHHLKIRLLPDSSSFLIALVLKEVTSPKCQDDIRMPISLHVLQLMFDTLPHVTHAYNATMFRSILALGFFTLLCPGELTPNM